MPVPLMPTVMRCRKQGNGRRGKVKENKKRLKKKKKVKEIGSPKEKAYSSSTQTLLHLSPNAFLRLKFNFHSFLLAN